MRRLAGRRPARGALHGSLDLAAAERARRALVEAHHDVGAQLLLDAHRPARGVNTWREPSYTEANSTPSSRSTRVSSRLNTWKPPESVRIGPRPAHEAVQAAVGGHDLGARAEEQVVGVGKHDLGAQLASSRGATALTVALVPTGMKHGVSTSPCGV